MPQIYFGFENETKPFIKTAQSWEEMMKGSGIKLYCGLAAYKCGKFDENAGSGKNEWEENSDILKKQYEYLSNNDSWSGFALFSYSYSFGENAFSPELSGLINCINES